MSDAQRVAGELLSAPRTVEELAAALDAYAAAERGRIIRHLRNQSSGWNDWRSSAVDYAADLIAAMEESRPPEARHG